jgi:hypothetical protein
MDRDILLDQTEEPTPILAFQAFKEEVKTMINRFIALVVVLSAATASAQELRPVAVVTDQPDSPIRVLGRQPGRATSQDRGTTPYFRVVASCANIADYIPLVRYELEIQNVSDQKVVAYRFGLVSFSVFNEYLSLKEGFRIQDVDPGDEDEATWNDYGFNDFNDSERPVPWCDGPSYNRRGDTTQFLTGVVYVDRVRFENGDIWLADLQPIGDRLRQIDENFDLTLLTEDRYRNPSRRP